MLNFAANLSMLFTELRFMDRFAAAAKAGFAGVEYLFPYDYEKAELADRLHAHGLRQVLFNLPAGKWDAGERGIACHPDRVDEFRAGVEVAIDYAIALGAPQINCLAGIAPLDVPQAAARETLVANLRFAADRLEQVGVGLLLEPINTYDIPGFFVSRSEAAIGIIRDTGSENIKLQYDIYHMQRMEGELANTLSKLFSAIGHIQLADNPGRNEPGTGEINYPFLIKHLQMIEYSGWIGCEYRPKADTVRGLDWLASARTQAHAKREKKHEGGVRRPRHHGRADGRPFDEGRS